MDAMPYNMIWQNQDIVKNINGHKTFNDAIVMLGIKPNNNNNINNNRSDEATASKRWKGTGEEEVGAGSPLHQGVGSLMEEGERTE